MLDTFSKNELLLKSGDSLLDRLLDSKDQLISFYFTDLNEFGLTENLYIRMNARGKMLTEFENFKSEFYKIINYNHELLEQVKDKIEYAWVDNLWQYRDEESFVIDEPFMEFLSFITEMLYFKQGEHRKIDIYQDFLDFKLLNKIYADENNLKFLIFSLDYIKQINIHKNLNLLWDDKTSLPGILTKIIEGRRDTNELYILFSAINFSYQGKDQANLYDFLRVVRNLIHNTKDNSRREWPRLLQSLDNLISNDNVYKLLININDSKDLLGFEVNQRNEEIFKAKLFKDLPDSKESIFIMEDNANFKGNISNLLLSVYANKEKDYENISIENTDSNIFILKECNATYEAYVQISKDNFKSIWGDLITTGLYTQTYESRLNFDSNYAKHPAILLFAKRFASNSKKTKLSDYLIQIQKEFIKKVEKKQPLFEEIREVKVQLYLYYILHSRIYEKEYWSFFKNGYFNFGWLAKEPKYKTLFTKGIEGCIYFPHSNPIFQVYNQQFRYNLGINPNNTLDIEIIGKCTKKEPFKKLVEWANS